MLHQLAGDRGGRVLRPGEGRADAHVDYLHAVGERALHRGDHDVRLGGAVAAEDPVGAEGHTGRDAGDARRVVGLRADDAGDVRAVAGAVHRVVVGSGHRGRRRRVVGIANEVVAVRDAAVGSDLVASAEVRVLIVESGVDDADPYARAGIAELRLRHVGAGHGERGGQLGLCRRRRRQ